MTQKVNLESMQVTYRLGLKILFDGYWTKNPIQRITD